MKPGLADCPNAVIVPHIASATLWTRAGMVGACQAGQAHSRACQVPELTWMQTCLCLQSRTAPRCEPSDAS